ncbi:MAG TPA: hypothetical protein ENK02_05530 [Planctomycetes bacterium]|nr:hypothetical protein [Planctomycetota bacterium]
MKTRLMFPWILGFASFLLLSSVSRAQFHDDFSSAKLSKAWTWTDPGNDSKFQVLPSSGILRMTVPPGNDHTTGHGSPLYAGPKLTVPVTGDFTITTHVTVNYPSVPTTMESGLMIWKDRNNNLQFKRTNGFANQNVLYYGNIANARTTFHGNKKISAKQVYLRITRVGDTFTSYYGTDGKTWSVGGKVVWKVSGTLGVGIATSYWLWFGSSRTPTTGDYDFFDLRIPSKETMSADRAGISNLAGGKIALNMNFKAPRAGRAYLMLAGFSGMKPGIPLPGGKFLPVNFDALTNLSLLLAGNPGVFPGSVGLLDASGKASAGLILPASKLSGLVGKSLIFGTVLFPKGANPWEVSNGVAVALRP